MIVDPPETIDEYRLSGWLFGRATTTMQRVGFEQTLVVILQALGDELLLSDLDAEEALAAFDQAAWTGWEAGQNGRQAVWEEAAASVTVSDDEEASS